MAEKTNVKWVIVAGMLAGVIINVGEFLAHRFVLHGELMRAVERAGLARPGPVALVGILANTFVAGIVLVWIFSLVRPRVPSTLGGAIVSGAMFFFLSTMWPLGPLAAAGLYTAKYLAIGLPWALGQSVLAAFAGGALYWRHT